MIENLLDMAARTAMKAFRLSAEYFYEDRKSGQRHPIACVERTAEYTDVDQAGNTIVYRGKVFMLVRADWEALDAWRSEMNIDVRKEPTPFGGDCILRVKEQSTTNSKTQSILPSLSTRPAELI